MSCQADEETLNRKLWADLEALPRGHQRNILQQVTGPSFPNWTENERAVVRRLLQLRKLSRNQRRSVLHQLASDQSRWWSKFPQRRTNRPHFPYRAPRRDATFEVLLNVYSELDNNRGEPPEGWTQDSRLPPPMTLGEVHRWLKSVEDEEVKPIPQKGRLESIRRLLNPQLPNLVRLLAALEHDEQLGSDVPIVEDVTSDFIFGLLRRLAKLSGEHKTSGVRNLTLIEAAERFQKGQNFSDCVNDLPQEKYKPSDWVKNGTHSNSFECQPCYPSELAKKIGCNDGTLKTYAVEHAKLEPRSQGEKDKQYSAAEVAAICNAFLDKSRTKKHRDGAAKVLAGG